MLFYISGLKKWKADMSLGTEDEYNTFETICCENTLIMNAVCYKCDESTYPGILWLREVNIIRGEDYGRQ